VLYRLWVAPRAGAWIETLLFNGRNNPPPSHPVRVRGLKLRYPKNMLSGLVSHPVRVRGLKHIFFKLFIFIILSHPVRVRGLKHIENIV